MGRRNMANQVLAGAFLLFVLADVLRHFYKGLLPIQLLYFISEAAIVGGVADWFAVSALFRKPLGFPWHTELIIRHRGRVISAVADMIEYELLSVNSIKERVGKISIINVVVDWVENKEGKLFFEKMIMLYSQKVLAAIDLKAGVTYLEELFVVKIKELQVGPPVKMAAQWALEEKRYKQGVSYLVEECITIIKTFETKEVIYEQLLKIQASQTKSILEKAVFWLAEQTDSINLSEVADALYEEILVVLYEAKEPDHILYQWVQEKLLEIIGKSEEDSVWPLMLEEWKQSVIGDMNMNAILTEFAGVAMESIQESPNSPILLWLTAQSKIYWTNFIKNQEAQLWLEESIKQALYKLIENEHQLIGVIIHNVLDTFSDEDLNNFIEEKAGEDLQWIRINGCVVGGVIGFILFGFLHYIYEPFVVPLLLGIFG